MVWPRGSSTGRMCPPPINAEQRLDGLARRSRAGQAAAIDVLLGDFLSPGRSCSGIAEASPYLFDLIRADAARADPGPAMRSGAASGTADRADPPRCLGRGERSRSDAAAASHEIGSGALDRAVRHRRRLAGDAGDGGADRSCGRLGAVGVALLLRQEATRGRMSPPNPDRPEEGSGLIVLAMGKMGAGELNYSSDIDLIVFFDADAPTLHPISNRSRSSSGSRKAVADAAAAQRRRLRVPGRFAAAARSGLDAGGDFDRIGAALLRAGRAHLGTRRHDQGAALRRRRAGPERR